MRREWLWWAFVALWTGAMLAGMQQVPERLEQRQQAQQEAEMRGGTWCESYPDTNPCLGGHE